MFTWYVEGEVGHLVNPVLDLSEEQQDGPEGCLSIPGLTIDCRRALSVVAKGFDLHGEPVVIEGSELLARAIQHETDHLDGVLFLDRLDTGEPQAGDEGDPRVRVVRPGRRARRSRCRPTPPAGSACEAVLMRVVFAGTPEVALPALAAIADSAHELVGVVTRPDAPTGRGRRLAPSPVAEAAEELGVPVLKPDHPRDPEFQDALRALAPDGCPVVAYGALLPAVGARHPAARLGQPALLAAARLARRRSRAARDLGRRRGHRRHHVPDRQGARRRPDLRR